MKTNWKKLGLSARRAKQIYELGCLGERDMWGEFDCLSPYADTCERCPFTILTERKMTREDMKLDIFTIDNDSCPLGENKD